MKNHEVRKFLRNLIHDKIVRLFRVSNGAFDEDYYFISKYYRGEVVMTRSSDKIISIVVRPRDVVCSCGLKYHVNISMWWLNYSAELGDTIVGEVGEDFEEVMDVYRSQLHTARKIRSTDGWEDTCEAIYHKDTRKVKPPKPKIVRNV